MTDSRSRWQRLIDAVLHRGPGYDLTPPAAEATDRATLAAMFTGLERLIATSSRDWGEYRVDAWLWAVLVGWDCEDDHEHDDLCDNGGAMREMQRKHGWDDEAVAKARRYRAAVRAVIAGESAGGDA